MIDDDSEEHVGIETSGRGEHIILAKRISGLNEPMSLGSNEYGCILVYSEDQVMASKMVIDYVSGLFNLEVSGLTIDRNNIWAIDWINNRQEQVLEDFYIFGNNKYDGTGDEAMDHALRNVRASKYFTFEMNVSDNYRFDGNLEPGNRLLIYAYGHWVTLDNLLSFDFIEITVRGSRLSIPDLYSFIRHWRAGGSPRLKFLRLEFDHQLDFEHFEDELEVVERDIAGEYRSRDDHFQNWRFDHGYCIQRNDGVKTVIDFGGGHFVMMNWSEIQLK
ncbi:hypothetical protein B9Z55_015813 [Caenorhabditis nigoni]|nr:hypothetical protein B9Z55_015813 [Caenorhabditis nigoni]